MQRLLRAQTGDASPMYAVHTVDIEQLAGRYRRLSQELAVAYSSVPWNTRHIDRLTHDLVATEHEIGVATMPATCELPADAGSDGRISERASMRLRLLVASQLTVGG